MVLKISFTAPYSSPDRQLSTLLHLRLNLNIWSLGVWAQVCQVTLEMETLKETRPDAPPPQGRQWGSQMQPLGVRLGAGVFSTVSCFLPARQFWAGAQGQWGGSLRRRLVVSVSMCTRGAVFFLKLGSTPISTDKSCHKSWTCQRDR